MPQLERKTSQSPDVHAGDNDTCGDLLGVLASVPDEVLRLAQAQASSELSDLHARLNPYSSPMQSKSLLNDAAEFAHETKQAASNVLGRKMARQESSRDMVAQGPRPVLKRIHLASALKDGVSATAAFLVAKAKQKRQNKKTAESSSDKLKVTESTLSIIVQQPRNINCNRGDHILSSENESYESSSDDENSHSSTTEDVSEDEVSDERNQAENCMVSESAGSSTEVSARASDPSNGDLRQDLCTMIADNDEEAIILSSTAQAIFSIARVDKPVQDTSAVSTQANDKIPLGPLRLERGARKKVSGQVHTNKPQNEVQSKDSNPQRPRGKRSVSNARVKLAGMLGEIARGAPLESSKTPTHSDGRLHADTVTEIAEVFDENLARCGARSTYTSSRSDAHNLFDEMLRQPNVLGRIKQRSSKS